jgi:hypothetical protein
MTRMWPHTVSDNALVQIMACGAARHYIKNNVVVFMVLGNRL